MSKFLRTFLALVAAWGITLGVSEMARGQSATVKGKLFVGCHKVKMREGYLYYIQVDGKGFNPYVSMSVGYLPSVPVDFRIRNRYKGLYLPHETKTKILYVLPSTSNLTGASFEYTFKVTAVALNKVVLNKDGSLTNTDPPFKSGFRKTKHHDSYPIALQANKDYVITMTGTEKERLNPALYLVDSKGNVAKSGMSDYQRGAQLVYTPTKAGNYQIIATYFGTNLGNYRLLVRTTK